MFYCTYEIRKNILQNHVPIFEKKKGKNFIFSTLWQEIYSFQRKPISLTFQVQTIKANDYANCTVI